ncbi:MAG: HDIG domain-containing protein [Bacteroidales bacterium]|nr:HDIG domain-containing protein [Bacteroidales bacterium]
MNQNNPDSGKRLSERAGWMRILFAAVMTAIILLVLPYADRQSFTYELNQPWRYALLTADFDMPIMRDSASSRILRDSVDARFVPFVIHDKEIGIKNVERFTTSLRGTGMPLKDCARLTGLLANAYEDGIVSSSLYDDLRKRKMTKVRLSAGTPDENSVKEVDARPLLSPIKAFEKIDSTFVASTKGQEHLSPQVADLLTRALVPNVTVDSVSDTKFRNQEYLNVSAAIGVIKKGQRIVDRGEIITPQIYTNLETYQQMLEESHGESRGHTYFLVGQGLYIIICITILYCYLSLYRRSFWKDTKKMGFLMSFITLFIVCAIEAFELFPNGLTLVPFAIVPVIILVFCDSRTAIFSLLITVLITALVATFAYPFIFTELAVGLLATFSLRQLSKRAQLLRAALITFIGYIICYVAITLLTEGTLSAFSWRVVMNYGVNCVIFSFAYVLIWLIEKIFGFTSTVTLVELSDINSPLLRRLAEEAPGTFQHSMQVSTLASEAARSIDANTQLVRTGALYHDIGKMESPVFFTENQHGVNPHAGLDPETSAHKIISHVTDGLEMASKEKLPGVIRDFISQHHGRGLTKYFYNTAVNERGAENVDPDKFRYPGPNPQSKETTILMMADAVEAASRSLQDYSQENIDRLVDGIVDSQIKDGLFNESPISFRDIEKIKNTFKRRLATIYHTRIAYPKIKN